MEKNQVTLSTNERYESSMRREPKAVQGAANLYSLLGKAIQRHLLLDKKGERVNLSENIRKLREKALLSGADLCRASGKLDPRTLSAIEKGRIRNPSLDTLQALAKGLGCLVRDLFTETELELTRNFYLGSQKGVFQMDFPALGLKVVSATPPIPQFFCGKITLSRQKKIAGELINRPTPIFVETVMGKVEFEVEGRVVILKEGENLFFNGGFRHSFKNLLARESTFWLVTAPSFFHA